MIHPIVELTWRLAVRCKRQANVVDFQAREIDRLNGEVSVQRARARRWRRAAQDLAAQHSERARVATDFQAASDDIADLPEIDKGEVR